MRRARIAAVVACVLAGLSVAGAAGTASAATPGIPRVLVVAPAQPIQTAGHGIQIPVYWKNLGADLFCSTSVVQLRWTYGGRTWAHTRRVGSEVEGATTTLRIPSRSVMPGVLRYVVTVDQECGLFVWPPSGIQWFSGRWPTTGAAEVMVVGADGQD
jgi:hypothetical protein